MWILRIREIEYYIQEVLNILVDWLFSVVLQEPWGFRERAGCSASCPGGLSGFSAVGPRLLHWHLGLSVLPRHCKLPVFLTKGEYLTWHSFVRLDPKVKQRTIVTEKQFFFLNLFIYSFFCRQAETHDSTLSKYGVPLKGIFDAQIWLLCLLCIICKKNKATCLPETCRDIKCKKSILVVNSPVAFFIDRVFNQTPLPLDM